MSQEEITLLLITEPEQQAHPTPRAPPTMHTYLGQPIARLFLVPQATGPALEQWFTGEVITPQRRGKRTVKYSDGETERVNANLLKSLLANHRNTLHRTPTKMLTPELSTTPLIHQKVRTPNLIQARIVRVQGGRPTTHRFPPTPQLGSMYETWLKRQIHPRRPKPIMTITSFKLNTDSPPTWYARAPDSPTLHILSTIEVVHSLPHPQQSSSPQSADTPDSQHRSDANPLSLPPNATQQSPQAFSPFSTLPPQRTYPFKKSTTSQNEAITQTHSGAFLEHKQNIHDLRYIRIDLIAQASRIPAEKQEP